MCIGTPTQDLFAASAPGGLFSEYRKPFPRRMADVILEKYKRLSGSTELDDSLFPFCYHRVKEACPQAFARTNVFLSLYGFARNLTLPSSSSVSSWLPLLERGARVTFGRWCCWGSLPLLRFSSDT